MPLCPHRIHSVYTFGHEELYRYVIVVHTCDMKMDTTGDSRAPLHQDKVINNMGRSVADGCKHTPPHTRAQTHHLRHFQGRRGALSGPFERNPEMWSTCLLIAANLSVFCPPPSSLSSLPPCLRPFFPCPSQAVANRNTSQERS